MTPHGTIFGVFLAFILSSLLMACLHVRMIGKATCGAEKVLWALGGLLLVVGALALGVLGCFARW